jgi:hypothetical protein
MKKKGGHWTLSVHTKQRHQSVVFQTDSINRFVADPRQQLNKTAIYNQTYDELQEILSLQKQEKECVFRLCVMDTIFATTNLTYQARVDRLIGIKNLPGKCREHVMDVLQPQTWKPPPCICLSWHNLCATFSWITRRQCTT